jgi:hypothetical protein
MSDYSHDELQLHNEHDRWHISVSWDHADRLHAHLKGQGFPSTLCLKPWDKVAHLELWPGVDVEAVRRLLDGLRADQPPQPPREAA